MEGSKKAKIFPSLRPIGSADLRFHNFTCTVADIVSTVKGEHRKMKFPKYLQIFAPFPQNISTKENGDTVGLQNLYKFL